MKNRNYIIIVFPKLFAALLMTICVSAVAFGQSILTDDANTSSLSKDIDSNFGTNPNLVVSPSNTSYVKFKLTPTLPIGTVALDVSKATLKIYVGNVSVSGTIDVFQVADTWSEKTITARTPAALADLLATGVSIDASRKGQYLLIDVTNAVKNWLDTSNNYGLALVGHDATSVTFDSKENSQTSQEPELIVALNSRMGPQGPQGAEGPEPMAALQTRSSGGVVLDNISFDFRPEDLVFDGKHYLGHQFGQRHYFQAEHSLVNWKELTTWKFV